MLGKSVTLLRALVFVRVVVIRCALVMRGRFWHTHVAGCHSLTRRDAGPETAGAMEGRGARRGVRAKGFPPAEGREPPAPPARHAEFLSKSYVPSTSSPRPTHADVPRSEREAGASTSTSWAGQLWKQYDPINRLIFPGVGVPATYDDRGKPFVGELQVRDVVYKTIVVKLPVLVPGGLCAPPIRVTCPCLVVLRADVQTLSRCRGRGVILYLHGNGTDIGGTAEEAKTLARELDCHVVVPEYPGYGLAEGSPSEDSVDAVAHAAARFIVETMGAPRDRLIIYGRSVGTGPAAAAAARLSRGATGLDANEAAGGANSSSGSTPPAPRVLPPAALALHSPYTSIFDFAREKAGNVLSYLLVSERWPTMTNMTRVACPTLLIHGDRDEVIPIRHSSRLRREAKRFPAPCQLHVQRGASHNVFDFFGDVADPLATFLRRHERAPWGKAGARADPMGLDLRDLERKIRDAGEGEAEEYPFANPGY